MDILSNFIIIILVLLVVDKFIKPLTFIKKHKNMLYGLVSGLILCKVVKYFRIEGFDLPPMQNVDQMSITDFFDKLCESRDSDNNMRSSDNINDSNRNISDNINDSNRNISDNINDSNRNISDSDRG
jgi:hypothetical protein